MLVNLAITFEPLPGAESKVIVVPETVKSSIGCNFLPSFLIANKCTLDGEPDKVNAVVERHLLMYQLMIPLDYLICLK